jgi:hypothetical protein
MGTLDLYAPDFPHGTPKGYNDGCRSNPVCPNFGDPDWLTCKEAGLARTTNFEFNRLPLDQKLPRKRTDVATAPTMAQPAKPKATAVPQRKPAAAIAAPAPKVEPALPLEDPHLSMTDKEKAAHYKSGCRETPCKAWKSAVNKAYSDRRKQADPAAASPVTTDVVRTEPTSAEVTYSIEHEVVLAATESVDEPLQDLADAPAEQTLQPAADHTKCVDKVADLREQLAEAEALLVGARHDYSTLWLSHEKLRADTRIDEQREKLEKALPADVTTSIAGTTITITIASR